MHEALPSQNKLEKLSHLYDEIWQWGTTTYDPLLTKRRLEAVDPASCLFIVGEAHAADQVRLTGINWFNKYSKIGPAGRYLDEILRCVGHTVYPPSRVKTSEGSIPARDPDLQTVYTTEIFPCYPPKGGAPTPQMLKDAQSQRFLIRELEIVRPKAILLLGDKSYQTFYASILNRSPSHTIKEAFDLLAPTISLSEFMGAKVIPFMHPSPQNGHFQKWFKSVRASLCAQPQVRTIAAAVAGESNPL